MVTSMRRRIMRPLPRPLRPQSVGTDTHRVSLKHLEELP